MDGELNVLNCLCHNVRRTSRLLTQLYDEALRPAGIRATQFTLLSALKEMGEPSQIPLANFLGVDRTTLSRNLDILERAGLLEIETAATDKRQQLIRLTREGAAVLEQAIPLWKGAQRKAIQRLSRGEMPRLLADLKSLGENP